MPRSLPLLPVFERLFDDAGLFPPARRPMAEALRAHDRVRTGAHREMVGPFLCPVARLGELDACVAAGLPRPPELGLIAYQGEASWGPAAGRPNVVQVEAPLDERLPARALRLRRYLELPARVDIDEAVDRVARAGARAKLRCGGLTPDAVPPARQVAEVLAACAERRLPLKATAGLHHPFRRGPASPGGPQHGFVNLLAAASAAVAGASVDHLTEVLETDEGGSTTLLDRIDRHARGLLVSIGTCSIDEPVAELRELGVL